MFLYGPPLYGVGGAKVYQIITICLNQNINYGQTSIVTVETGTGSIGCNMQAKHHKCQHAYMTRERELENISLIRLLLNLAELS